MPWQLITFEDKIIKFKIYIALRIEMRINTVWKHFNQLYQFRYINKKIGETACRYGKKMYTICEAAPYDEWDYSFFIGNNNCKQYLASWYSSNISIYKNFEKLNLRLQVQKQIRVNLFGRFGFLYSIPMTYEPWSKNYLFCSRELIFMLELLESAILSPPKPGFQKKGSWKSVDLT